MSEALRFSLKSALSAFAKQPLREASLGFFKTLGYSSQRTVVVPKSAPGAFLELFAKSGPFDQSKALFSDWLAADLLFQLTDQEISREVALFPGEFSAGQLRSYIFFAVELKERDYPRGKLANLARQLNRLFPTPLMVLIKHHDLVSIAVINRRQNKVHADRDVLEKVTLIRDISLSTPHRGHLDILASFAVPNLFHPQRLPIATFDALHAAWEQIFNIELLNERFYRELANWYFWALPQVDFPADLEPDAEKRRATGLIRLLTRLIFCWFLKEKGLIPDKLFHPTDLAKLLKGFDPESETSSTYYLAILQNLFFATLNQRMGKDSKGQPYRTFATDEGFLKNKATHDINNLYRYENLFADSPDAALGLFADVPFLNGGLFECLDRTDETTAQKRYLDGFSRNPKKRPHVSNHLFFAPTHKANLSGKDAYNDPKKKKEDVTGLVHILGRYKFTIVENTPIDQEIALDPELLGKVFENLLASYNEETKTTARKQTGSFYTPRPIVDYMVDEALKAHLTRVLVEKASMSVPDAREGLDLLFAYTEKEHSFTAAEVAILIAAVDALKILDPACGSGAFPMGVLHKLVYILQKLDPGNERWKETQLAKLDSPSMRDELERAFAENNDDYGRKLSLIENCLYGVDIQPIAIQITKLRFFISLVADQKTSRDKAKNLNIKPLPNLETKFVAADTLMGLPIPEPDLFIRSLIEPIEREIERCYHNHFSIQRRDQKIALQKKIKELRSKLADTIINGLGASNNSEITRKARHLAEWDAFNPQHTADFFDPHWMFGRVVANGFDIVIANPPYYFLSGKGSLVQKLAKEGRHDEAERLRIYFDRVSERLFRSSEGCRDYYKWFIERGLALASKKGVLAYITPNTFLTLNRYADVRKLFFSPDEKTSAVVDLGFDVFDIPIVPSAITVVSQKIDSRKKAAVSYADLKQTGRTFDSAEAIASAVENEQLEVAYKDSQLLLFKHPIAESIYLQATQTGANYFKAKEGEHGLDMSQLVDTSPAPKGFVPVVIDSELSRFRFCREGSVPLSACPKLDRDLHSGKRMYVRKTGDSIVCGFPPSENVAVAHQNVYVLKAHDKNLHWTISAILNSSVATFLYRCGIHGQKGRIMAQFRVHALEAVPFPQSITKKQAELFSSLIPLFREAPGNIHSFLEDLIDACVMECYFHEHMAERELLFHDLVSPHLAGYDVAASHAQQRDFLTHLHATLNAPSHPIRNRLLRLTADSPDLLAVIKAEGRA